MNGEKKNWANSFFSHVWSGEEWREKWKFLLLPWQISRMSTKHHVTIDIQWFLWFLWAMTETILHNWALNCFILSTKNYFFHLSVFHKIFTFSCSPYNSIWLASLCFYFEFSNVGVVKTERTRIDAQELKIRCVKGRRFSFERDEFFGIVNFCCKFITQI